MTPFHRRRLQHVGGVLTLCLIIYVFNVYDYSVRTEKNVYSWVPDLHVKPTSPNRTVLDSLSLDEETCFATFPGLTKSIDDLVALGPFTLKQARDMGPLQARIKDGQLYIVHMEHKDIMSQGLQDSRIATLHQIHRAILTSPTPLPDTIFSVNVQDGPVNTTWSYSNPAYTASSPGNPPISRAFLMPHFSFWGWPLPWVGSFARAAAAIDALESSLPFSGKDKRAVWRGTVRYNSAHNPQLRKKLIEKTTGAAWADVQELKWDEVERGPGRKENIASNSLMIEDFCKYKYLIHTEGITYSGRFQFLQMCRSVLLTPPIAWMQHTTHLVKPLFSFGLGVGKSKKWTLSAGEQRAWPFHYKPVDANIVFVSPDWSDLEDTLGWLEDHPQVAEGIARRQRELFVDRGYFSPAAEACYWRALIRGWSKVVRTDGEGWESQVGIRWEQLSLGHES